MTCVPPRLQPFWGVEFFDPERLNEDTLRFLKETQIKVLLISPAYQIDEEKWWSYNNIFSQDLMAGRRILNQKTAEFVSLYKTRFRGLCGYNYRWIDGNNVTEECLKHNFMVGLKARFGYEEQSEMNFSDVLSMERMSDNDIYMRFVETLELNKQKIKIALIHAATWDFNSIGEVHAHKHWGWDLEFNDQERNEIFQKDVLELDHYIRLAKSFPNIQFILAHSLNSPRVVNELAKKIKKEKGLKNLWIEISTAESFSGSDDPEEFFKSWKNFGIDRVLFGSDLALGADSAETFYENGSDVASYSTIIRYVSDRVRDSNVLTEEEKSKILYKTAKH